MRIFLNGFMGSGKTTIGKQLAVQMNYYFVDLDNYIEEKTFSKINLLFKQFGETEFRKIEHEYLLDLAVYDNMIVACGGGTITDLVNEKWMNQNGITVFLKQNFETIFKRLNNKEQIGKRPLLKAMEGKDFESKLLQLFEQRQKLYEKCQLIIDLKGNANPIELIESELKKRL